jgi:hypothetical protein
MRLRIVADNSDWQHFSKPAECWSFQEWIGMTKAAPKPRDAMADILKSPRGTRLRYRDRFGRIERSIVEGQDPSLFRQRGSTFELVHMSMSAPAPLLKDRPGGGRWVHLFFQALEGEITEENCRSISEDLSKNLNLPLMLTRFRPDPIFIEPAEYPILHPLIRLREEPPEEMYRTRTAFSCVMWYGELTCSKYLH